MTFHDSIRQINGLLDEAMDAEQRANEQGHDATLYVNRRGAFAHALAILNGTTLGAEYDESKKRRGVFGTWRGPARRP